MQNQNSIFAFPYTDLNRALCASTPQGDNALRCARLIQQSASDKVKLRRNVDPDIVARLANFVLHVEGESEEERQKN